jgi:hypothetical protein
MRYGATPEKIKYIALQVFDGMYSQETIDKWLKFFIKRFFNQFIIAWKGKPVKNCQEEMSIFSERAKKIPLSLVILPI